jgi:DNA-binding transcriptional MerR regulator
MAEKFLIDSNTVYWQIAHMPRTTPSHSGLKISPQPSSFASLQDLAEAVNDWCAERGFVPASGQAAANLSERSLRYYRTLGLLDGPATGEGTAYGERHFLQLASIRALQSRGMPLRRIQELLYGRDDANLRELLTRAKSEQQPVATMPPFSTETWNVTPLEGSFALIGRDGARPTAAQVAAINRILQKKQKVTSR